MRISNFLLWQIAYAELYVTETLWPDFTRTDLLQAVLEYQKRDRRYGGLSGAPMNAPVNGTASRATRTCSKRFARHEAAPDGRRADSLRSSTWCCAPNFWIFLAVLAAVALLCYREYDGIAAAYGFGAPGPLGYGAGLLLLVWEGDAWLPCRGRRPGGAGAGHARRRPGQCAAPRVAAAAGVVYIFGCWKCALPLREASPHWLMYGLMVNWAGDIGAYYVGRAFGRTRWRRA